MFTQIFVIIVFHIFQDFQETLFCEVAFERKSNREVAAKARDFEIEHSLFVDYVLNVDTRVLHCLLDVGLSH